MKTTEAIAGNLKMADMVCGMYLDDLTDAEAMTRPHAGCNHVNWQIGHIIMSENKMANGCFDGLLPPLPDGFEEKYAKEQAGNDDASAFHTKTELMAIRAEQRDAILKKLESVTEQELSAPAPEAFQAYAPTVGDLCNMMGGHWMMHAGQFVVVRRVLGREIVI